MESQFVVKSNDFAANLGHLKSVIEQQWLAQTAMWILVSALSFSLLGFILQKIFPISVESWLFYTILIAIAATLTLTCQFKFRKQLEDELVLLDQRFQLKALLRTAYEVHHVGQQSFIADKLIQTATTSFHYLPLNQLYGYHYKRPLLVITSCLAVFFLINSLPAMAPEFLKSAIANLAGNKSLYEETENLKPFYKLENISNPSEIQKPEEELAQKDLEERVTEMIKKAQKSDALNQQTIQEKNRLKNELSEAQSEIAKNLPAQIDPHLANKLPSLESILQHGINPEYLDQIEEELSNLSAEEIPFSLSESLAALNRNRELEQMLEKSLAQEERGIQQERSNDSEQAGREGGADSNEGRESPNTERSNSEERGGNGGLADQSTQTGNDSQFFPGDGMGDLSHQEAGSQAGDMPSKGIRQTPSPAQRARDAISKIKGLSGEGKHTKALVQTLTTIGEAELPTIAFNRKYEQDLETVFQKEKIPLHYRQLIKNYFLAIDDKIK